MGVPTMYCCIIAVFMDCSSYVVIIFFNSSVLCMCYIRLDDVLSSGLIILSFKSMCLLI